MKTETFKGTVESAYGKSLPSAISFNGTYEAYENLSEVPTKDRLSDADLLAVYNAREKAAARAKATAEALQAAGIEKPDTSSPEFVREQMVKSLVKLGHSESDARKVVESMTAALAK